MTQYSKMIATKPSKFEKQTTKHFLDRSNNIVSNSVISLHEIPKNETSITLQRVKNRQFDTILRLHTHTPHTQTHIKSSTHQIYAVTSAYSETTIVYGNIYTPILLYNQHH